jgi:hypothetical protein
VGILAFMGAWPGKVARARNHPQAEAIAIGSWLTLFLGFVLWPAVAIWAHLRPVVALVPGAGDDVTRRLHALEERVAALEGGAPAGPGEGGLR